MARKRRRINPFSLSFLDIMACGFGAVTLLFLILKHDVGSATGEPGVRAEADLLREEIRTGEKDLVALRNSLARMEEQIVEARGLSKRIVGRIEETRRELSVQSDPEDEIARLRKQVEEMEREVAEQREQGRDRNVRRFVGEGDRQYLTGLKLGGERVLILLDASASMLAEDIVNVLRRRNMDEDIRRRADKWRRALRTVEWLLAQLPPRSRYQVYTFNTAVRPAIEGSAGTWQDAADRAAMDRAVAALRERVPGDGTSLVNAFSAAGDFRQGPDNIFLITDGLPTQGRKPPAANTVSGRKRVELFDEATRALPDAPVNIILFPMEGDPMAAALFWQLAVASRGAFLSPASDWP
jgi:hypothetical protein